MRRYKNPVHHVQGHVRVSACTLPGTLFNELRSLFDDAGAVRPSAEVQNDATRPLRSSLECVERPAVLRNLYMQLDSFVMQSLKAWGEPMFKGTAREQFMLYRSGTGCGNHIDDQFTVAERIGKTKYGMHLLNQVAGILYVSSADLRGGELVFTDLNFSVPATTGTLVCFPSNMDYWHSVSPIEAGERIAIARHYYVEDSPAA